MDKTNILDDWKNRNCVLATMHKKEKIISPILEQELGIIVTVPKNFNTDSFGTFTNQVRRTGNQLEAARRKALAAMKLTGMDLGIASEGSFGLHPSIPFLPSNLEIVVLIDRYHDLEIIGHHRTNNLHVKKTEVKTPEEAKNTALSWGFPNQGVIVSLSEKRKSDVFKNIESLEELEEVSKLLLSKYFVKSIILETDMRANRCPSRMNAINQATVDLINNCKSLCPKCHTPGFVITDIIKGLLCRNCNLPTDLAKEVVYSCQKCKHQENKSATNKVDSGAGGCQWCNP